MQLPEVFSEEMKRLLGEDFPVWMKCLDEKESFRGLRINTQKIGKEELQRLLPFELTPVPWTENGCYIDGDGKASRHPAYAAGLYYLQEPSAMTPAACLPVEEGDRVLDLCAAPGGKATELAAKLGGTGILVANDISNSRAKALLKNLELCGAGNILVTSESPERLGSYFEGWFDKILIDAPCSGEGMFRKDPSMMRDWTEKGPSYYSQIQEEITAEAARLLKPGGQLLYSTCTFSVQENEETVLKLLRGNPGFHVLPLPLKGKYSDFGFAPGRPDLVGEELTEWEREELLLAARLYPHKIQGEGHFLCLLQKEGEPSSCKERTSSFYKSSLYKEGKSSSCKGGKKSSGKEMSGEKLPKEWTEFASLLKTQRIKEENLRLYDQRLYWLPDELLSCRIRGLRFLRTGLYLGEVRQKRFEPSQALAMFLRKEEFSSCLDFPAGDERILRYLKGETIDAEDLEDGDGRQKRKSGWRLVCMEGHPLGWGKMSGGTLKNKYYAGWRW